MLFPYSHGWTRRQRWLIAGAVVAGVATFAAFVYTHERYYRGPDDSFFIGTWKGELQGLGDTRSDYRFNSDHSYEEGVMTGDGEEWYPRGKWFAGGEFLYLRYRSDALFASYYDPGPNGEELEIWHIESMSPNEVRMHHEMDRGTWKRAK